MLTTVTIPAYNAEETLREAVESALGQTAGEPEVLVVDDGSRIPAAEVLGGMGGERLRVVRHERNRGVAVARNTALAQVTTPLFSQLDADDLWEPGYLEAVLPCFERDEVGLAYADALIMRADGSLEPYLTSHLEHPIDGFPELTRINPIPAVTATMRTDAVRAVGGYASWLWGAEDYHLYLKLAAAGWRFAYVDRPLARYRWLEEQGMTRDVGRLKRSELRLFATLKLRHPRLPGPGRRVAQLLAELPRRMLHDLIREAMTERSQEQLRQHYEVERELADRLRSAPPQERKQLYSHVYDELFRRVPDHPQLAWKADAAERARAIDAQLAVLAPFLTPETTFLEVGAGDCALSLAVAGRVRRVYALDVSEEITRGLETPDNFELILSDGTSVPVPAGSVDLAYSNQLMEHLHPDDATEQLRNIHRSLAPGGAYVCITPNRLLGPADISKYFDEVATGFHLREYTNRELAALCREVGFRRVQALVWLKWFGVRVPAWIPAAVERLAERLPRAARRPLGRLLGVNLVAWS